MIIEKPVYKIVNDKPVLDYTLKEYWENGALTKTEQHMNDAVGTIYEGHFTKTFISRVQVYPVPPVVEIVKTDKQLIKELQEKVTILEGLPPKVTVLEGKVDTLTLSKG